ncbi:hypothetical protein SE17_31500 [Kouleothrix aurantiaca]|uniref:Uncharacterized protein n=1 Tax=Kouleothrix aurantiaca TaxID=186479 RepID=A0A0P9FAN1_9CHLR|nr:hypothetical protein SE17_31500 [Kouleothrix aurantiaca]
MAGSYRADNVGAADLPCVSCRCGATKPAQPGFYQHANKNAHQNADKDAHQDADKDAHQDANCHRYQHAGKHTERQFRHNISAGCRYLCQPEQRYQQLRHRYQHVDCGRQQREAGLSAL